MAEDSPSKWYIRGNTLVVVRYDFGDTSVTSFSLFWDMFLEQIKYRFGAWGSDKEWNVQRREVREFSRYGR